MLHIKFELLPEAEQISGQPSDGAMGHMTIIGPYGSATSKGHDPDQSMMLFYAILELLDGLNGFVDDNTEAQYLFIATDSSFSIRFKPAPNDDLMVYSLDRLLDRAPARELIAAIAGASIKFATDCRTASKDFQRRVEFFGKRLLNAVR